MSTRRPTSAQLDGRVSTVIDGTGVARGFTDLIRQARVGFTPVTITAGKSRSRGEHAIDMSRNRSCYPSLQRTSRAANCASSTRRWARS